MSKFEKKGVNLKIIITKFKYSDRKRSKAKLISVHNNSKLYFSCNFAANDCISAESLPSIGQIEVRLDVYWSSLVCLQWSICTNWIKSKKNDLTTHSARTFTLWSYLCGCDVWKDLFVCNWTEFRGLFRFTGRKGFISEDVINGFGLGPMLSALRKPMK